MKISEIFKKEKRTFSFEFFPPKDEISAVDFGINMGQLIKLSPSFITVTYGAGGSTRERTFALVDYLQNRTGLVTMAHYTCVNAPVSKIDEDISHLSTLGIENLMLLRGDPPKGTFVFKAHPEGFRYANELISHVKNIGDFCVGGAAYPEMHPESENLESEIINLKKKVEAGAEFLVTQMFFDNQAYFNFVEKAREQGISCRIIPGIIPITNYRQINKFLSLSNAKIPGELKEKLERIKDDPEKVYQTGIDFAIRQCHELLQKGAPGIHFYTLNKSRAAVDIFETLKGDFR